MYNVHAILLGASAGLSATAYSNLGGGVLSNALVTSHHDIRQGLQLSNLSQFYAIYSGYFHVTRSGAYTFRISKYDSLKESIVMSVGGSNVQIVMNQTNCSSVSSGNCEVAASFVLEGPGNLYSVNVEYVRDDFSLQGGNFSLNFQFQNAPYLEMMPYLFPSIGTKLDALEILVSPSTAIAASSIASGNCLTLATAGSACQFSIEFRDKFGSPSLDLPNLSILCSSFVDMRYVSQNSKA